MKEQSKFKKFIKKYKHFLIILGGLAIGSINGFFGGGGGMLAVPLLTSVMGLEEKNAHATAISIILPLSVCSGVIYVTKGYLKLDVFGYVTIGVIAGGLLGSLLLKKLSNKILRMIFYIIMIVAGVRMVM